jgi:hypothetical protein
MDVAMREKTANVAADLGLKPKELAKVAQGVAGVVADAYLPIRRMQYHAKQAWMLRSFLHRVEDTAKAA